MELKEPLFPPSSCNPHSVTVLKTLQKEAVVHEGLCCFLSFGDVYMFWNHKSVVWILQEAICACKNFTSFF